MPDSKNSIEKIYMFTPTDPNNPQPAEDPMMTAGEEEAVDPSEYVGRLKAAKSRLSSFQDDLNSHGQRIAQTDEMEKSRRIFELNKLFAKLTAMGFDLSSSAGVNQMLDQMEERQPGSRQLLQNLFDLLDPNAIETPDFSNVGAQLPPELADQMEPVGFGFGGQGQPTAGEGTAA